MKNNKFFEVAESVVKASLTFEEALKKVKVMAENMEASERKEFVDAFAVIAKEMK